MMDTAIAHDAAKTDRYAFGVNRRSKSSNIMEPKTTQIMAVSQRVARIRYA
jgi:hypothetical protein